MSIPENPILNHLHLFVNLKEIFLNSNDHQQILLFILALRLNISLLTKINSKEYDEKINQIENAKKFYEKEID